MSNIETVMTVFFKGYTMAAKVAAKIFSFLQSKKTV